MNNILTFVTSLIFLVNIYSLKIDLKDLRNILLDPANIKKRPMLISTTIADITNGAPYKIVETKSGTEGVKYNDENGNPVNNKKVGYVKVMEREKE